MDRWSTVMSDEREAPELPAQRAADIETRATEDHHESLRLWLRMLACTKLLETRIRQHLHLQFGTTLPRFDLLAQLERVPEGLTMGDLSQRMMVTCGNVTGIAKALEIEGLILRQPDPQDRRAYSVKLTPEGRRLFARMAAAHESWVTELLDVFSPAEKIALGSQLGRLKTHVHSLKRRPKKR
jgi:DNA-binding MarR family transcriptional regulator